MTGTIKAISISSKKGRRKDNVQSTQLISRFGLAGDAHGGEWHRQVSLLAQESIDFMRAKGLDVVAGNFAENITTEKINLTALAVGDHLRLGDTELIISQLGKICHTRCAIYHQAGDCVMPREGIFGVIRKPGEIHVGDRIDKVPERSISAAIVASQDTDQNTIAKLGNKVASAFSPGFIRVDQITTKTGGSLQAILSDLTQTQKIDHIVIFDPDGTLGLDIIQYPTADGGSRILRIRSISEIS